MREQYGNTTGRFVRSFNGTSAFNCESHRDQGGLAALVGVGTRKITNLERVNALATSIQKIHEVHFARVVKVQNARTCAVKYAQVRSSSRLGGFPNQACSCVVRGRGKNHNYRLAPEISVRRWPLATRDARLVEIEHKG